MSRFLPPGPDSSPAELRAFDTVCERLQGFDDELCFELVDGFLTALAAGPRLPPPEQWLPAICGDAFERAFADPQDHAQGLHALQTRLKLLCRQLDPEALLDAPEVLRLMPLVAEIDAEQRQRLIDEGAISAEDASVLQTGALWAQGFFDAVQAFPDLWAVPEASPPAPEFAACLDQIAALVFPPDGADAQAHRATYWPRGSPTRDELLDEACWAVQDLRLLWLDVAPRPVQRTVAPQPGRNDPCPCGSGKKYKKCCGTGAGAGA